ncbi:MAG: sensor histidine kinase [Crocinitomicaceae bacterium]
MNQIITDRAYKYLYYTCLAAIPLWLAWIAFDYVFAREFYLNFLPLRIGGSILSFLVIVSLEKKWLSVSKLQILMFLEYNIAVAYMLIVVDKSVLDIYFNGYAMIMIVMFFILILNWKDLLAFIFIVLFSFTFILIFSPLSYLDIFGHGGFVFLTIFFLMIVFGYLRYQGVLRDVSLAVEIEKAKETKELNIILASANRDKETLLQEVHHRVKNNLQVISSILSLQNSYTKDIDTKEVLTESIQRIRSMSVIHETLYKSKNFASIDFSSYLYSLTNEIISAYKDRSDLTLKIIEKLEPLQLDISQAIPCGLIVNELLTNSVKHAFKELKKGEIYLNIREKEGTVFLEIGDNGNGLPENFEFLQSESLGLQLVQTLVEQLEGEIIIERIDGTLFRIQFKLNKKRL